MFNMKITAAEEKTLTRASKEWLARPDDERYLTLDDL